ncbi:hypothetical protein [Mucilaginibacter sp. UYCu711]|uniref:hypothetical protein n=1 Tax=Mucilaginibacter sp. UYCu711 TaxID=3156339 RepID=UPI003D1963A5
MNRSLKSIALLFCLGAMISSCSRKVEAVVPDAQPIFPLADFTVKPDALDGFTFKFTNASTKFTKLEMRFGDDSLSTSADVSHTYVNTGDPAKQFKYTIDLKAISSTGDISHKYLDIPIYPDSIIQLSTARIATTSKTGTVKFTAKVKAANVKSYLWTFTDNRSTSPVIFTRTEASPEVELFIGSFNQFTVKIVTDKGSTASLTRSVTVDGIATDITASYINNSPLYPAAITTVENTAQGVNEGASKLVDGNLTTKFGYYSAFPQPLIVTLQFPAPVVVKSYGIMNGNDSQSSRDPKQWAIEGSNSKDGPWIELDNITLTKGFYDMGTDLGLSGNGPSGIDIRYRKWWYYPLKTTGAYTFYRWRVISTFASAFQITELAFFK